MPGLQREPSRVGKAEVAHSCGKDKRMGCLSLEPAQGTEVLGEVWAGSTWQEWGLLGFSTGRFPEHGGSGAAGSLSLQEMSKWGNIPVPPRNGFFRELSSSLIQPVRNLGKRASIYLMPPAPTQQ